MLEKVVMVSCVLFIMFIVSLLVYFFLNTQKEKYGELKDLISGVAIVFLFISVVVWAFYIGKYLSLSI